MRDRDLDEILQRAGTASPQLDPSLLERISSSLGSSLRPVRPLPPSWMLASAVALVCIGIALAGAACLGLQGVHALSAAQIAAIFSILAVLTWIASVSAAGAMTPGSMRQIPAGLLSLTCSVGLIAVFAAVFHDFRTTAFIHKGLVCLALGLSFAAAAGAGSWFVLRRGFAVRPLAAGLVTGTLASLSGVLALELHCPNLETWHVLVWHTAVVPCSGLAGAAVAWLAIFRHDRQSSRTAGNHLP